LSSTKRWIAVTADGARVLAYFLLGTVVASQGFADMREVQRIDRSELERKLAASAPDHVSKSRGYVLINVLRPANFAEQHIPRSINVPLADIDVLQDLYSKDKEIIVYCASAECGASPRAAQALVERGFENVYDYERGLSDWRDAGNRLSGSNI
jgi:rhodanese-related sulfurtransferase